MIGRQVKICTGFTQSIQILRRKKIKKIYCPMTVLIEVEVGKKYCRTRNLNYDTIEFYPQMYTKSQYFK